LKLSDADEKIIVTMEKDGKHISTQSLMSRKKKIVIVINNQLTNSPNTTQIASGAGRNSAAGNNAAIDSSNTQQQQSVGAQGKAKNLGMRDYQTEPHEKNEDYEDEESITIVINNQINEATEESSATQVASGGGTDSAGGTNAAIQSSNTKQQHAVGGDQSGSAFNIGMDSQQAETAEEDKEEKPKNTADGINSIPG
jgi:hypothetical protein